MICDKPYVQGVRAFPCGQCMPCRINRRRLWSNRILLESCKHEHNSFLTLTYAPDNLPLLQADDPTSATLAPRDLQLFIKRLRKICSRPIRYFAVGEYGDETWRPHYHAALFGVSPLEVELVRKAWSIDGKPIGHIMLGDLSRASAAYIAQYCTKKLTAADDPRLQGRHPEFTRMSLRPGIGALAVDDIVKSLSGSLGKRMLDATGDVPLSIKIGGKDVPLGRYLRRKIRQGLDLYKVNPATGEITYGTPEKILSQFETEMRALLEAELGSASHSSPWSKERVGEKLVELSKGKSLTKTARDKIYKSRRKL